MSCGQEFAVDIEFADPSRDELGELAAEVEDHDGLAILGVGGGGTVIRRSVRAGGLQRRFEVGLHLGIVRGQDAMAGVGRLTVNGLATLPLARR